MCKIVAFTNLSKVKSLDRVIDICAEYLNKYEHDGFGYTIQGTKGPFGERTTAPTFTRSFTRPVINEKWVIQNYNRYGVKTRTGHAGIFHGRTSTNHKTIENTHPIVKGGLHLIHNGVVSNQGPNYDMTTTNDTEHLAHYLTTMGISGVEANLSGYYAVCAIDEKTGDLIIFRDSIARLSCAYIESIDSFIFATTEVLIKEICKALNLKHSVISGVKDNTMLVFNKGFQVDYREIEPMGYTAKESIHAGKSLGVSLVPDSPRTDWTKEPAKEPDFTQDELSFLDEVENFADSTYSFFDFKKNPLTYDEFQSLEVDEKLYCIVIRSDGTLCSPTDYNTLTYWTGVA